MLGIMMLRGGEAGGDVCFRLLVPCERCAGQTGRGRYPLEAFGKHPIAKRHELRPSRGSRLNSIPLLWHTGVKRWLIFSIRPALIYVRSGQILLTLINSNSFCDILYLTESPFSPFYVGLFITLVTIDRLYRDVTDSSFSRMMMI